MTVEHSAEYLAVATKEVTMKTTRMAELAALVSTNTTKIDHYLRSHSLPSPSFDVNAPSDLGIPPEATEIDDARKAALEASIELQDLLQGPTSLLRPVVCILGASTALSAPNCHPRPYLSYSSTAQAFKPYTNTRLPSKFPSMGQSLSHN